MKACRYKIMKKRKKLRDAFITIQSEMRENENKSYKKVLKEIKEIFRIKYIVYITIN